jgi:HEAT repeat protein
VRIALKVAGHRVVDLVTRVGGHWRDESRTVTDLGEVPAAQAAGFLLDLAESDRSIGSDAIFPATIADSVEVWPRLLAMGRNRSLAREARNQAVFWLSQAAGEAATRGLDSLVNDENGDREIRKQAVFALSQRPHEEGTTALLKVARTNRDPEIRRTALFWLGQSQDPRALDLFEELLTRR